MLFRSIYATPGSSSAPAWLKIDDFGATQKGSWFSDLYAQSPGGSTPLKQAFSTAARVFTGKLGPDPVLYSCQQNFMILTTDGYWNAGSPNPVNVNGGPLNYIQIQEVIAFIRATSDQTFVKRDPTTDEPLTDASGKTQTFAGWRDPAWSPAPSATPVPDCWSSAFTC